MFIIAPFTTYSTVGKMKKQPKRLLTGEWITLEDVSSEIRQAKNGKYFMILFYKAWKTIKITKAKSRTLMAGYKEEGMGSSLSGILLLFYRIKSILARVVVTVAQHYKCT